MFQRLAFTFELAINFIRVHEELDVRKLFGTGHVAKTLKAEIRAEVRSSGGGSSSSSK